MNEHLSTERIIDFVHGELSPADDALAHAHLAACSDCREAYEIEALLSEALRSAAKAEELEMPSIAASRLAAWLRPAYAIPVAAALLVGGFFASPLAHRAGPTIDATYYLEAHAAQAAQTPLSERSSSLVLETSMIANPTSSAFVDASADGLATTGAIDDVR